MKDKLIELLCNIQCTGKEDFGNCPHRFAQKCNKIQRLEMCAIFATAKHLLANNVIVLPCKVNDKVSVRALCECVFTQPCAEEGRYICPFEDKCDHENCNSCNESIFDTKISAIYNNGQGWLIEFEHLIIQAQFTDLGISFFIGENAHEQAVAYNKALAEKSTHETPTLP